MQQKSERGYYIEYWGAVYFFKEMDYKRYLSAAASLLTPGDAEPTKYGGVRVCILEWNMTEATTEDVRDILLANLHAGEKRPTTKWGKIRHKRAVAL